MAIPPGLGQKLEEYYAAKGDASKLQKQHVSNQATQDMRLSRFCQLPVAVTPQLSGVSATAICLLKSHVDFFTDSNGYLFATFSSLGNVIASFSEKEIFHTGYLFDVSVNDMSSADKKDFLGRLSTMKVRTIRDKYLAVW